MKAAVSEIDLVSLAERLGYTPQRIGAGKHNLKEMDSLVIYNRKTWYRFSGKGNRTGGNQIIFCRRIWKYDISRGYAVSFGEYRLSFAGKDREKSLPAVPSNRKREKERRKGSLCPSKTFLGL